jgi:hypothetical protein
MLEKQTLENSCNTLIRKLCLWISLVQRFPWSMLYKSINICEEAGSGPGAVAAIATVYNFYGEAETGNGIMRLRHFCTTCTGFWKEASCSIDILYLLQPFKLVNKK